MAWLIDRQGTFEDIQCACHVSAPDYSPELVEQTSDNCTGLRE